MKNDFIDMIEPTPKLYSKKCKLISFIIWFFLKFSIYIITFVVWYTYNYFIAFFIFLLTFIIIGIIRSKLRNMAIAVSQQEYHYNDKEIANWFTAKEICLEEK